MDNIQERVTLFTNGWHKVHVGNLIPKEYIDQSKEKANFRKKWVILKILKSSKDSLIVKVGMYSIHLDLGYKYHHWNKASPKDCNQTTMSWWIQKNENF